MFEINDRVHRQEAQGDNNAQITLATIMALDGEYLGLNYDERAEPGVVHGWWTTESLSPAEEA